MSNTASASSMSSSSMTQEPHSFVEFRSGDLEPARFVEAIISGGKRFKRARPSFYTSEEEEQGFSSSVADDEEEQEQQLAAYSLIMIARAYSSSPPSQSTTVKLGLSSKRKIKKPNNFDEVYHEEAVKRYKCKTCNKKFFSFQALGGHRASCQGKAKSLLMHNGGFDHQLIDDSQNPSVKLHECPICNRVFFNGQALGGHKRIHSLPHLSPFPAKAEPQLELNMPAPVDDGGTETEEDLSALSYTVTPPHYENFNYKFSPYCSMEKSGVVAVKQFHFSFFLHSSSPWKSRISRS